MFPPDTPFLSFRFFLPLLFFLLGGRLRSVESCCCDTGVIDPVLRIFDEYLWIIIVSNCTCAIPIIPMAKVLLELPGIEEESGLNDIIYWDGRFFLWTILPVRKLEIEIGQWRIGY